MTYAIELSQLFQDNFRALPKTAARLVMSKIPLLQDDPRPLGKLKTMLKGFGKPKRYRIRAGDYRVIYTYSRDAVQLLNVDKRSEVYVRNTGKKYVPIDADKITDADTSIEVVETTTLPEHEWVFYRQQTKNWLRQNVAVMAAPTGNKVEPKQPQTTAPRKPAVKPVPLPKQITSSMLDRIRIPEEYHDILVACRTDADLVNAISVENVPAEIVDRVFSVVADPDYEAVAAQPTRTVKSIDDLQRFYDHDLIELQLTLDPSQKPVSQRIVQEHGAWLVEGAPGTGKSTVLLDAAIELARLERQKAEPRAILVTTFTKALATAFEDMLGRIYPEFKGWIEIKTADRIALDIIQAVNEWKAVQDESTLMGMLRDIMQSLERSTAQGVLGAEVIYPAKLKADDPIHPTMFPHITWSYLLHEIENVIVANDVQTEEDYLTAPRAGRKIELSDNERKIVWGIHRLLQHSLDARRGTTYPRIRRRAAELMQAGRVTYRMAAVFVDEAQDLQPNAIRMLVEVAKSNTGHVEHLALASDSNQAIYSSGHSWTSIHPDLKLKGRVLPLTHNHRSTQQIFDAATRCLSNAALTKASSSLQHRYIGPVPLAIKNVGWNEEIDHICSFLTDACGQTKLDYDMCAVLVPETRRGYRLMYQLREHGIPATFMKSHDLDLSAPGVKVMTRHAAKGLEFPIVALALAGGRHKNEGPTNDMVEARLLDRRVNHMAMTRAMRSLLVTLPHDADPELIAGITEPLWRVESAT